MSKYFGTDGFRGEAGTELTAEHAFKIGRYLGICFGKEHRCRAVIGKDTRWSGFMLEYALAAGLMSVGADAYLMHVTTTPSVSYAVCSGGFDCGIMISASHNPFYDNGIKLIDGIGGKTGDETVAGAEMYLDGMDGMTDVFSPAMRGDIGVAVDYEAGCQEYIKHLIGLGGDGVGGLKVGLDTANGSASGMAEEIFEAIGAKTFAIENSPDGFNINRKCGSTSPQTLSEFVREKHLDIGFAFDGDADRCLCVDENGDVITGDHILYIYGCYMKERGKLIDNTVVTTVMSNFGLYKAFDAAGIDYEKTKVGDKYVYECMSKNGYRLGGEQSGHIIFSKYATTGDGIITALKMMEVMIAKKKTLAQLAAPLHIYPQVLKNVRVYDKPTAQNDEDVKAAVARVAEALGENGRILVRESGTEPVIRVMVEAGTHDECEAYVDEVIEVIKSKGYVAG